MKDSNGGTPLFIAVKKGFVPCIKKLFTFKGNTKKAVFMARGSKNNNGETIEHIIAERGDI